MEFHVFVEGDCEYKTLSKFLKKWLDKRLAKPVRIKVSNLRGSGGYHRRIADRVRTIDEQKKDTNIVGIIGLLDLYGLPFTFPKSYTSAKQRYDYAKRKIQKTVNIPSFHQFFAVHEYEAWLLSQPAIFPRNVQSRFPKKITNPEKVNFKTPPAKLLGKTYQKAHRKRYNKVIDGATLFNRLDPEIAYDKCPYLKQMLDKMLELARQAEADTEKGT